MKKYVIGILMVSLVICALLNMNAGSSLIVNNSINSNHKLDTKQYVKNEEKHAPVQNLLNKTQLTIKGSNQSNENPVNNVLLSGLGGSLGGALVGGFLASFLQTFYSDRSVRRKDHLSDLKKDVVDQLTQIVSDTNFTLTDFENKFIGFRFEAGRNLESDHVLFQDFIANHYSDLHAQLKNLLELKSDLSKREHPLLNELKLGILYFRR